MPHGLRERGPGDVLGIQRLNVLLPRTRQRALGGQHIENVSDPRLVAAQRDAGFDYFQIHHRVETPEAQLDAWAQLVGEKHLWLAPKLPPGTDVPSATLAAAKFILFDTFHAEGFGGSGKTGDWSAFARQQASHPKNFWILAGGLNSENIGEALRASSARFVDVNSGVESAPGVKDEAKLKRFVVALHQAATAKR